MEIFEVERLNMESSSIILVIDHNACVADVRIAKDLPVAEAKEAFSVSLRDTPFAFGYDWLVDLTALASTVVEQDISYIADAWAEVAKGRDVGKRTEIVSRGDQIQNLKVVLDQSLPYRTVRIFPPK